MRAWTYTRPSAPSLASGSCPSSPNLHQPPLRPLPAPPDPSRPLPSPRLWNIRCGLAAQVFSIHSRHSSSAALSCVGSVVPSNVTVGYMYMLSSPGGRMAPLGDMIVVDHDSVCCPTLCGDVTREDVGGTGRSCVEGVVGRAPGSR